MGVFPASATAQIIRRLEWAVGVIARHPDYPGKAEAVQRCREDIERRFRLGMLDEGQRRRLHSILEGGDMQD